MPKSTFQIRRSAKLLVQAAAFVALVAVAGDAFGCPTCKDGIAASDPHARQVAAGYFYSILFMMSMPFAILGGLGAVAYRSIRRAQQAQAGLAIGEEADA